MNFFSALLDEWSLDAGCNQLWQNLGLPEPMFQLDVDSPSGSSVSPQPTAASGTVDLEDASNGFGISPSSTSSSIDDIVSMYSNPAVDFEGFQWQQLEESSSVSPSSSPSVSSSSSEMVSMANNPAVDFEGFQWPQSEESLGCTPAQSVAEECNPAPSIYITPPQPLVFMGTVPVQAFAIDRASAWCHGFDVAIDRGKTAFDAPWTVRVVVFLQLRDLVF
jgi:hypothetical protein